MTHWTDAGFGTDPEGDDRRRAELSDREWAVDELARLHPTAIRAAHERVEDAVLDRLHVEPVEPEVLPAAIGPHAITRTEYRWGIAWTCACGRWEAVATGPSSAGWAGADHARHVADEQAAGRD